MGTQGRGQTIGGERNIGSMEFQQDFLGRDGRDRDKQLVQFWTTEERVRDFDLWWKSKGFPSRSATLVMIIAKIIDNERTMHDPRTLEPIKEALNDINEFLPTMAKYGLFKNYRK